MHLINPLIKRAVPAFLMGMAFLVFSCGTGQRGVLPEKRLAPLTGYSDALADYEAGRYGKALEAFNRMLAGRQGHPEARMIRYYKIFSLYHTGDYRGALSLAMEWLKDFPESPERYRMQRLAGDSNRAMGQMYDACFWMTISIKTARAAGVSGDYEGQTIEVVKDIISMSSETELNRIKGLDSILSFMPSINLRQAEIAFDKDAFIQAKRLATLAMNSASEQKDTGLVIKARELISRISESKEEGRRADKKVIGCLLPLKGDYALYGEELLRGLQLGLDLFGTGEESVPIELVIKNTNASQGDTVAAINELIQLEMVVAVIGPLSQSASTVAAKKAQEQGVPIITFSQRPDITKGSEWVFRNYLTPDKEVEALVKKAIGDMGMLRFGIFYPDSSYGSHLMTVFWDTVEEMGGEITASESYKPGDTDFSEGIKKLAGLYYPRPKSVVDALVAQRLRDLGFAGPETMETQGRAPDPEDQQADSAAVEDALCTMDIEVQGPDGIPDRIITSARRSQFINPDTGEPDMALIEHYARTDPIIDFDAVFIPDNSRNIALIAPQFPFYNVFNVPFLGTSLWLSDELVKTTSDYMQGAIFPVGFYADNESPGIMDFVSLYREAYGKEPGLLAATGFDTIKMIKGLLTENDILTRADFRDALLGYENYSGVTGQISFDEEGEVEKMPTLLTIHGKGYHILK